MGNRHSQNPINVSENLHRRATGIDAHAYPPPYEEIVRVKTVNEIKQAVLNIFLRKAFAI
jgi:hypothetical protein